MDPFTADEMIDETHFDTPELAAKAKAFFNKNTKPVFYFDFDKDGFKAAADLFEYDDDDYWGDQNRVLSSRKWNGSRFVKSVRWYTTEDYNTVQYN
jgi:hypothetical protein